MRFDLPQGLADWAVTVPDVTVIYTIEIFSELPDQLPIAQAAPIAGEGLEAAAYRELQEEVGLSPSDVNLVGRTERWLRYRLPSKYVRRNRYPMCIGQKQRWFLLRLKDEEPRFDFTRTSEPEFDHYRWVNYWEPVREVIYFKREVYVRALTELAPFAFPDGPPPHPSWWAQTTANALTRARSATAPIE